MEQKYWKRVCDMQQAQTDKGIKKYGQILEQNTQLTPTERVTYLQEELVDALMYCEHLKELIYNGGQLGGQTNTADDYQKAAMRTMSPETLENPLLNGALGLAGESGEVADHIKKHKFQGHQLDKEHLIKELGDICWYVATTAYGLGVPLSEVMERNIEKLRKRYPNEFETERSLHREEK